MWLSQAEAEGLTLLKADNKAGYFGVYHHPGELKPYKAVVWRGGKLVHLGSFATLRGCRRDGWRRRKLQRRLRHR